MTEKIINTNFVKDAVGRWEAGDLAFIERLVVGVDLSGDVLVTMTALFQRRDHAASWPNMNERFAQVELQFDGVRDITLKWAGKGAKQVLGFYIDDISDKGWEDIRFSVGDYENDHISFKCRAITIGGSSGDSILN